MISRRAGPDDVSYSMYSLVSSASKNALLVRLDTLPAGHFQPPLRASVFLAWISRKLQLYVSSSMEDKC